MIDRKMASIIAALLAAPLPHRRSRRRWQRSGTDGNRVGIENRGARFLLAFTAKNTDASIHFVDRRRDQH
jgi:hypothetical protein